MIKGWPDPETEADYLAADRLGEFGFSGWIGPEPHGSNPLNSGSSAAGAIGRDEKFATQAVDLLHELAARGRDGRPWLMVNSYVNPHDIAVWGASTLKSPSWNLRGQLEGSDVPDRLFDPARYAATANEDLPGKPAASPTMFRRIRRCSRRCTTRRSTTGSTTSCSRT